MSSLCLKKSAVQCLVAIFKLKILNSRVLSENVLACNSWQLNAGLKTGKLVILAIKATHIFLTVEERSQFTR